MTHAAQDWKAAQAARQVLAAALQAANPHLVPVSEKNDSLVAAAKNIRIELAARFPSVKFTVKSKRFSMGDSINVTWIDGPTTPQVDAIIGRYSAGSFDGMTDSYTYSRDTFTDAFGDAKYVHSHRDYSAGFLAAVMGRVCRMYGVASIPTAADWNAGKVWNLVNSNGSDVGRAISCALSRHTCCA